MHRPYCWLRDNSRLHINRTLSPRLTGTRASYYTTRYLPSVNLHPVLTSFYLSTTYRGLYLRQIKSLINTDTHQT
jgi:hypothetical protein